MVKKAKKPLVTFFKRERELAHFTQTQVAERLGISLRSLQAYEEGAYVPPFDRAVKLADLYGCSVAAFAETRSDCGK